MHCSIQTQAIEANRTIEQYRLGEYQNDEPVVGVHMRRTDKKNHRSLPYQKESLHIDQSKKLTNKRAVCLYQTFNVMGVSIYS